jgi:hypothetical protein
MKNLVILLMLCFTSWMAQAQKMILRASSNSEATSLTVASDAIYSNNYSLCLTCATYLNDIPYDLHGGGTKLLWLPQLSAFRAGTVENNTNYWDSGLVGNWSFATGYNTVARGNFSTAFGLYSKAFGGISTVFGWGVEANDYATFACGSYNVIANGSRDIFYPTEQIFVIGNGTSNANRKNALTVLKNGNIGISVTDPVSKLDIVGSNTGWRSHFNYAVDGTEDTYIRGGKAGSKVIINDVNGLGSVGIGTTPNLNSDERVDIKGRLRIRSAGSNTVSTAGVWFNNSTNSIAGNDGAFSGMKADTEVGLFIGGAWRFWVANTGNATLTGTLTQSSDRRLKKDLSLLSNSLSDIYQLKGYHYKWIEASRSQDLQTGLIAQEVQKIFPELVQTDEKGFLSVNYIGLIPHLIEAVKELRNENGLLKNNDTITKQKTQTLENRLEKVEAMLTILTQNNGK